MRSISAALLAAAEKAQSEKPLAQHILDLSFGDLVMSPGQLELVVAAHYGDPWDDLLPKIPHATAAVLDSLDAMDDYFMVTFAVTKKSQSTNSQSTLIMVRDACPPYTPLRTPTKKEEARAECIAKFKAAFIDKVARCQTVFLTFKI